jgi:hypothetical protein
MSDPGTTRTPNKAARNERIKITAARLNGASIAALAVGCFAPITAAITALFVFVFTGWSDRRDRERANRKPAPTLPIS